MIVFITTPGHTATVAPLFDGRFDQKLPRVGVATYDQLFRARRLPAATYIFSDIERLYPWELRLASELYRAFGEAGLTRLNNPAIVKSRYELLRALYAAKYNPFNAYRADDLPRPERFPVILRREADHRPPSDQLIGSQTELDDRLNQARQDGTPLRGWLLIEFCAQPIAPGMWHQFGTFRIGDAMHVDHGVVEDSWCVKFGTAGLATEEIFAETRQSMITNEFADAVRPAFEIGAIEYGRADHATVDGRQVVYEINTNPTIREPKPLRRSRVYWEALAFSRARLAKLLWQIDSGSGKKITFPRGNRLEQYRRQNFWTRSPIRP